MLLPYCWHDECALMLLCNFFVSFGLDVVGPLFLTSNAQDVKVQRYVN